MMHQSIVLPKAFFTVLMLFVVTLALSGCAGKHKAQQQEITFWPDPELPRVQYLMTINSNVDVEEKQKAISLVTIGDPEKAVFNPLIKPGGVKAHKGKIYITDAGRSSVFIVDPVNKTFEGLKGNFGRGSLNKPLNLAFDQDDNLYVADVNGRCIKVYRPDGRYLRTIGKDIDLKPTSVGVDGEFVYALDTKAHEIRIFDRSSGDYLRSIGQGSSDPLDNLYLPFDLDVDKQGALHMTNIGTGRVVTLDRDGHVLNTFGKLGANFAHFARPRGIATDDAGSFYIVDASHQNVQVFNRDGRLLMFFGGTQTMQLPSGVDVTTDNLDFFQGMAAPGFKLDAIALVTSHFGKRRLGVYGLGKLEEIDYEQEYEAIKKELEELSRKQREEEEKKKKKE